MWTSEYKHLQNQIRTWFGMRPKISTFMTAERIDSLSSELHQLSSHVLSYSILRYWISSIKQPGNAHNHRSTKQTHQPQRHPYYNNERRPQVHRTNHWRQQQWNPQGPRCDFWQQGMVNRIFWKSKTVVGVLPLMESMKTAMSWVNLSLTPRAWLWNTPGWLT